MSKKDFTTVVLLCAALAACSDGITNRTLTAPDAGPASSEAVAGPGFAVTVDGPFDVYFAPDDALGLRSAASLAAAPLSAATQAAAGSRTSGHVGFSSGLPTLGLASERYSFVSLSTDVPTAAAKGEFELQLTSASGVDQKFHGDVICMATVGNSTRLAGQLTKVWINNVQRPITGATHVIWTVTDNGEGQGTTDTASPMFFNNATNAAFHCAVGFPPPQFPIQEGEIQVR